MTIKLILLVGTGSFIGGVLRYLISFPLLHKYPHGFPWGTLMVNILGCFLIGLLYGYVNKVSLAGEWRMFLATGVLGGFTTFSAFSNETITLFNNGQSGSAALYVGSSVIIGLLATVFGMYLTRLG
jgi:CrcB protein